MEELITELVSEKGYSPRLGLEWDTKWRYELSQYVLIRPILLCEKRGVKRGRIAAKISFILLKCHAESNINDISQMWREVKQDAVEIITEIEQEGAILELSKVEIAPLKKEISSYKEVAVEVTATVVANYKIDDNSPSILQ